jgi:hypothetical protein
MKMKRSTAIKAAALLLVPSLLAAYMWIMSYYRERSEGDAR